MDGTLAINQLISKDERCKELAHPYVGNFILSCLLLIGILVSYLPQHLKIIHNRSSEGLSPYFVLLGATSGTCAIANILVLPLSRIDIACCKINNGFSCAAGLLGIAQIGVQWGCFFLITLLYLLFIPRTTMRRTDDGLAATPSDYQWKQALAVFTISIVFFVAIFFTSVVMLGAYPHQLQSWAEILGFLGAVLACIQYFPQIYLTWRRRSVGSLSIGMMCIQTPGSFVFVVSLAMRLGLEGWSTWLVYLMTGMLQGSLLAMALWFTFTLEDTSADSEDSFEDIEPNVASARETDPLVTVPQGREASSGSSHGISTRNTSRKSSAYGSIRPRESLNGNSSSGRHGFANIASILATHCSLDPLEGVKKAQTEYFDAPSRKHSRTHSSDTIIGPGVRASAGTSRSVGASRRQSLSEISAGINGKYLQDGR